MMIGVKLIKEIVHRSSLRPFLFPVYRYNMSPPQLCFLCQCIEQTRDVPGCVVEVGCSTGETTIFLKKYMDAQGIEKAYVCLDTFSGFMAEDIAHEVAVRNKSPGVFTGFRANKKAWFDATMRANGVSGVRSIESDVNRFNFSTLGAISFALLDVDLYHPTKHSLMPLFRQLSPGGILVVDDCDPSNALWDGSNQAYKEFVCEIGHPAQVVFGKLGIIRTSNLS
jgi:O-methyltransferase